MSETIKIPGRIESVATGKVVTGANAILDDTKGKKQNVINEETDAELLRLDQEKQGNLTFDQTPTEDSTNPVTSGGVYAADQMLSQAIEAILLLIPSAASELNKLVDLATMNSSISTATASFKGTYNLVSDLHLTVSATHAQIAAALDALSLGADNNDYAFVQVPNTDTAPTDIAKTERYKFNGENWAYEYDLNNSGFTTAQWNAINSGITTLLVAKLSALPTNEALTLALAGKQDSLTFDNAPTAGSNNPVKSGGIYTRNNEIVALINALDAAKQDVLVFDTTPTNGSTNPVTSNGVYLAIQLVQTAVVALDGRMGTAETKISTAEGNIVNLQAAYAALTQSDIVVVEGVLPSSGQQNIIYRQSDQDHTPPQFYSDYMWNGTAWVLMATYNNAIDPRPKKGSQNLVTSGGVFDNMGALDVSELNATENPHTLKPYDTLDAALADIPSDYQKGGMSVKYVQSSDNKYVQYRLMNPNWSTTPSDWQGVDAVPTPGSKNMAESGGVSSVVGEYIGVTEKGGNGIIPYHYRDGGFFEVNGTTFVFQPFSGYGAKYTDYIPVQEGDSFFMLGGDNGIYANVAEQVVFFNFNKEVVSSLPIRDTMVRYCTLVVTVPSGVSFVVFQGCYNLSTMPTLPFAVSKVGTTWNDFVDSQIKDYNQNIVTIDGYYKLISDTYSYQKLDGYSCKQVFPVPCKPGDKFVYKGKSNYSVLGWMILFNNIILSTGQYNGETEIEIQSSYEVGGINYVPNSIRFCSYGITGNVELEVYKKGTLEFSSAFVEKKLLLDSFNMLDAKDFIDGKYLGDDDGQLYNKNASWAGACVSGVINVEGLKEVSLNNIEQYLYSICGYDDNGFVKKLRLSSKKDIPLHVFISDNIKYIRLCWIATNSSDTYSFDDISRKSILVAGFCDEKSFEHGIYPNIDKRDNPLWGKKWVACGDSFTHGDFSGLTDVIEYEFQDSPFKGKNKVYPHFIGRRNNMDIVIDAINGSIMALDKTYVADPENVPINTKYPFSYQRYLSAEFADADYITLWFGINDAHNTNLGTIDDTTNETFYGAWNVVLEYFITHYSFAKIGIIVTNGSNSTEYKQAVRDVAQKWGIPYLDMTKNVQIPPIFERDSSLKYSSVAQSVRTSAFVVSQNNRHPNAKAHEYESYFIEDWLRTL